MHTLRSLLSKLEKIESDKPEKLTMYCFAENTHSDEQLQQRVDDVQADNPERNVVGIRWQE